MNIITDFLPAFHSLLTWAQNITVITHIAPDGDAIGSLTAVGLALQQLGKNVTLRCDDPAPPAITYVSLSDQITFPNQEIDGGDLIIAVDCGDTGRMGRSFAGIRQPLPPIINIDHHKTNTLFGTVNIVVAEATATTEILHQLLPALSVQITPDIATSLLTGLVTDTLGFRIPTVTAHTVQVGSELMQAGANLNDIMSEALNLKPLATLRLHQKGLANMHFERGFLWTTISQAEREEVGHDIPGGDGLSSIFGNVREAVMGAVIIEEHDNVYVSMRCRPPWDVAAVATKLGGGGHQFAAGCRLDPPLADATQRVVEAAWQEIEHQKQQS